jgi:hypothetical protein
MNKTRVNERISERRQQIPSLQGTKQSGTIERVRTNDTKFSTQIKCRLNRILSAKICAICVFTVFAIIKERLICLLLIGFGYLLGLNEKTYNNKGCKSLFFTSILDCFRLIVVRIEKLLGNVAIAMTRECSTIINSIVRIDNANASLAMTAHRKNNCQLIFAHSIIIFDAFCFASGLIQTKRNKPKLK